MAGGPSLTAPVTNGATGSKGRLCEEGKRRRREGEGGGSRNFSCPHFLQPLPEKGETLAYVGGVGLLPKSGGRENRVVGFSSLPKPRFKARREERSIFPTHWRDRQLLFLLRLFPTGQEAPNERLKQMRKKRFRVSPLLFFLFPSFEEVAPPEVTEEGFSRVQHTPRPHSVSVKTDFSHSFFPLSVCMRIANAICHPPRAREKEPRQPLRSLYLLPFLSLTLGRAAGKGGKEQRPDRRMGQDGEGGES